MEGHYHYNKAHHSSGLPATDTAPVSENAHPPRYKQYTTKTVPPNRSIAGSSRAIHRMDKPTASDSRFQCNPVKIKPHNKSDVYARGFYYDDQDSSALFSDHDFGNCHDGGYLQGILATQLKKYNLSDEDRHQFIQRTITWNTTCHKWSLRNLTTVIQTLTKLQILSPDIDRDSRIQAQKNQLTISLLKAIIQLVNKDPDSEHINEYCMTNLMWVMPQLVCKNQKVMTALKQTLATTLPLVNKKKEAFKAQGISNSLSALAKLTEHMPTLAAAIYNTASSLLPLVISKKDTFNHQGIFITFWAMAKLIDKSPGLTPKLTNAMMQLLPVIDKHNDAFESYKLPVLLWSMSKWADQVKALTPETRHTAITLLSSVAKNKAELDHQGISNALIAMAKLACHDPELKPHISTALNELLPVLKININSFNDQSIANSAWAMAKLELTAETREAIAVLLPQASTLTYSFNSQGIANLLWAIATLNDKGLKLTPELITTFSALVSDAERKKQDFYHQEISNVLWAIAFMGEALPTKNSLTLFLSWTDTIIEHTQQLKNVDIDQLLWSLMAFYGRLQKADISAQQKLRSAIIALYDESNKQLAKHRTPRTHSILSMAAFWLDKPYLPWKPSKITPISSKAHKQLSEKLKDHFKSHILKDEESEKGLPPVDIMFPNLRLAIEVQGSQHYIDSDYQVRNGSTLLKRASYEKLGYRVLDVPVRDVDDDEFIQALCDSIHHSISKKADRPKKAARRKKPQ